MHDVVIVGGSLAGAATAIHLARRGRRVLIIEQRTFPRRKVCGEGILPMGAHELSELGLADVVESHGALLDGIRFVAGRQSVDAMFPGGQHGIGIRRTQLDAMLLARASEAGVEIVRETASRFRMRDGRVAAIECVSGEAYEGRVFAGADGLHSRVRRLAGLETPKAGRRYGAAAHGRLPGLEPGIVQVHFLGGHEVYVTPVGHDTANIVVLLPREKLLALAPHPEMALTRMLAAMPALQGLVLDEPLMVAGPFPRSARRAWRGNVALAGDAAGFFDGVTGEGMGAALVGARHCALALNSWLDAGSSEWLRTYDRIHRSLVRNSTLLARLTLALGAHPKVAELAIRNLSRHPETFARLVAINGGESRFRDLRPHDLMTMIAGH
jgi:flavin-dependent dehydrogenase